MARIAFEKIMAGLDDALAYADGDSLRGMSHQVKVADVDITHLREKLGLSQDRFAALFGLVPEPFATGSRVSVIPKDLRGFCFR